MQSSRSCFRPPAGSTDYGCLSTAAPSSSMVMPIPSTMALTVGQAGATSLRSILP
jgi:hypothetical protein